MRPSPRAGVPPTSGPARAALAAALVAALLLPGCAAPEAARGPDVVATFYPLAWMAGRIAGPDLAVETLVPAGAEPHDWEPSPRDLLRVGNARAFVHLGAGFEPWAAALVREVEARGGVAVEASRGIALREGGQAHEGEEEAHEGEQGHEGEAGGAEEADPHVWLDPVLAQVLAGNLAEALAAVDPANATAHRQRAEALQADLAALDLRFRQGLAECRNRNILTTHAAFGYLADRYAFQQHGIAGLSPEAEPSPARLAEAVELARALNLTHVFFETLVSPRVAETIAREVGAQTLVLDPVEGLREQDRAAGLDYVGVMDRNLANLRLAMGCA